MEFPKALMSISELKTLGFGERQLRAIAKEVGTPVCLRTGTGKTSTLLFDTKELYAYIVRQSKMMERR